MLLLAIVGFMFGWMLGNPVLGFCGAIVGVWAYVLVFGKPKISHGVDPHTGQAVILRQNPSLYLIPVKICAVILTFVFGFMAFIMKDAGNGPKFDPKANLELASTSTGETAFKAANEMISRLTSKTAFGNGVGADTLAQKFAHAIRAGSKTTAEFHTYCRVTGDGNLVFITRVPGLRKFSDDEKIAIGTKAWALANQLAASLEPKPQRLAVGIRGIVSYSEVLVGKPDEAPTRHDGSSDALHSSFTVPSKPDTDAEPVAPAAVAE